MACLTIIANATLSEVNFSSNNYINEWGRLKLSGIQLSDEKGEPVQLKGWSSFYNYSENCLTNETSLQLAKSYGANCVRIAQSTGASGKFSDDQIKNWMKQTADNGMYCIIDYEIYDASPSSYLSSAKTFFTTVANEVNSKNYKHVIYEICGEPNNATWNTIKTYATEVISTITAIDTKKPVIIVGTPNSCQTINSSVAKSNNLISTSNAYVMYSFHFYANEHSLQKNLVTEFLPASKTIPVFASEWSMSALTSATNSYNDINPVLSRQFMACCDGLNGCGQTVSWINWSFGMKQEGSSTFQDNNGTLSPSGNFVVNALSNQYNIMPVSAPYNNVPALSLDFASENATLNLGHYNVNPNKTEGQWASAYGISYWDADATAEEGNGENYDVTTTIYSDFNGKYVLKGYAAREYCTFRTDEAVDLMNTKIEGSWNNSLYGLGWITPGEWIDYTIYVEDPGYYSIQMAANTSHPGAGSYTVNGTTGAVTYQSGSGFALEAISQNGNQILESSSMVDIDASSMTEEAAMDQDLFTPYITNTVNGAAPTDEDDYVWCYTGNYTGTQIENYGILFKETGTYVVRLSFPYGHYGLGGLRFSFEKPWTGEGYPSYATAINETDNASEADILYIPSSCEVSVNAEATRLAIIDMTGKTVAATKANSINASYLTAGIYVAKAYSGNKCIATKKFFKNK